MDANSQKTKGQTRLSEDWLALIIGLGLTFLVWIGAIRSIPWPLFGFLE